MRKIHALLFCFVFVHAHAQLDKYTRIIGLQTTLISGDYGNTDATFKLGNPSDVSINLVPGYSVTLYRNWIVGIQGTLGIRQDNNSSIIAGTSYRFSDTYYDFGFAYFTRYYLDITRNKGLKIFGLGALDLLHARTRFTVESTAGKSVTLVHKTTLEGDYGGGLAWVGKKWMFDLSAARSGLRIGAYKLLFRKKYFSG